MSRKPLHAVIFGLAGTVLTETEKKFFSAFNPVGFILFARNCETPGQLKALVISLKALLEREDVLILIDQEGGRVARLKPPHWRHAPAAGIFADLADDSLLLAKQSVYANARLIARELYDLGINVNCAPLADVPVVNAHAIIGDRAYGDDAHQVSILALKMAKGLLDGGVLPVLKHIPGHGRANADSHESLPIVKEPLEILQRSDFIPFRALSFLPLGMTAHIVYTALDEHLPATLSSAAIAYIRQEIGFNGLLMSDDICMKALKGSLSDLTRQTVAAGCDVVLHCNGNMQEMQEIADSVTVMHDNAQQRLYAALLQLKPPQSYDYGQAEQFLKQH